MDMKINIDEAQSRVNIEKQTQTLHNYSLGTPRQMGTTSRWVLWDILPFEKKFDD